MLVSSYLAIITLEEGWVDTKKHVAGINGLIGDVIFVIIFTFSQMKHDFYLFTVFAKMYS